MRTGIPFKEYKLIIYGERKGYPFDAVAAELERRFNKTEQLIVVTPKHKRAQVVIDIEVVPWHTP